MKLIGSHDLRTEYGKFVLYGFECGNPTEVIVVLKRHDHNSKGAWTVRIQYGCLFGTAFHSVDCDCARQLDYSMRRIAKNGRGLILYFPQREANGAGLAAKIKMNAVKMKSEARLREVTTGMAQAPTEMRKLGVVKKMLRKLEIDEPIILLTNSPRKLAALKKVGVEIQAVIHFKIPEAKLSSFGRKELKVKRKFLGHWNPL